VTNRLHLYDQLQPNTTRESDALVLCCFPFCPSPNYGRIAGDESLAKSSNWSTEKEYALEVRDRKNSVWFGSPWSSRRRRAARFARPIRSGKTMTLRPSGAEPDRGRIVPQRVLLIPRVDQCAAAPRRIVCFFTYALFRI